MSEFKINSPHEAADEPRYGVANESDNASGPRTNLPVTDWNAYKAWCEKVKRDWDES